MIEAPAAYPHLSGRANLALFDAMGRGSRRRGRAGRVDDALDRVGLGGVDSRPVRAYSLGMRQRLGLANALIRQPRLLVLDEPTNGLDPQGIRDIRALLLELNAAGTTVFVSSHLLLEIEQMCTRVGVLDRGRLVLQEHLDDLRAPTGRVVLRTRDTADARRLLDSRIDEADGDRDRRARRRPGRPGRRAGRAPASPSTSWSPSAARSRTSCWPRPAPAATPSPGPTGDGRAVIGVELRKLLRSRRTWATILLVDALPTLVGVLLAITDLGPATGRGAGVPVGRADRRHAVPPGGAGDRAAAVPADRGGDHRRARRSPARPRPARCATCWCARSAGCGSWWPSSSPSLVFVVLTVLVVAVTAYVVGLLLLGDQSVTATGATSVSGSSLSTPELVGRTFLALGYAILCMLGVATIALFLSTAVSSSLGAALGTMAVFVGSALLHDARRVRRDQRLPADALLAGVRRPVPRPDPVARPAGGGAAAGAPTWRCSSPRPGPTSRPRTSPD